MGGSTTMTDVELFREMRQASKLWLPAFLHNLVELVPGLCDADGCSLFLVSGELLQLAATTRQNMRARLFAEDTSYHIGKDRLKFAADDYLRNPNAQLSRGAGLTGWVATFNQPLNLADITQDSERAAIAEKLKLPMPVWSDRLRGFFDFEGHRPFLAVPLRDRENRVRGVIRTYSVRKYARPFLPEREQRLLRFGEALANFLVDHGFTENLDEYFRLWSAQDGRELARRLTVAVPKLWRMDCCSFFRRDAQNRFVLQHCAVSSNLSSENREHFERFRGDNLNELYYDENVESKTGLCIRRQEALLLHRGSGTWSIIEPERADTMPEFELKAESNPQYVAGSHQDSVSCELTPDQSKSILLIPVRDTANPRMLAGVLRAVSAQDNLAAHKAVFEELKAFAGPLAERLGHSVRQEVESEACQKLIDQLRNVHGTVEEQKWHEAAQIAAEALDADVVTIFLTDGGVLRSKPSYSYLNVEQIRREQPNARLAACQQNHVRFSKALGSLEYAFGHGCTGLAAKTKRVLNIRNLDDPKELERFGVEGHNPYLCDIPDAGPFIAAPLTVNPIGTVDGVIRALRWKRSPQGPFTASHELTLSTFSTMLASVSRVWQPSAASIAEPTVVVSYSDAQLREQVVRFLAALGVKALHLGDTPAGPYTGPKFEELVKEAGGGIVIATSKPNDPTRAVSQNVAEEMGVLKARFPGRVFVLFEESVVMHANSRDLPSESFKIETGISWTFTTLAKMVRSWI